MKNPVLTVALLTEVFFDDPEGARLTGRLREARSAGAEFAVLPELPLDPWIPMKRESDPADAEEAEGRRHGIQAEAARCAGISVLGGAIVRDSKTGRRHNTALLFSKDGSVAGSYRKIHLPYENEFWEAAHYEPGTHPPEVITSLALPVGIQICSDGNRTSGCQILSAQGAAVIVLPRATPPSTWDRWRLVLRANAVTSAAWVVTVNRPPANGKEPTGGPSAVIAPEGTVVCETTDRMAIVEIDGDAVERARTDYPGYLDFHPEVYREAWDLLAGKPDQGVGDRKMD